MLLITTFCVREPRAFFADVCHNSLQFSIEIMLQWLYWVKKKFGDKLDTMMITKLKKKEGKTIKTSKILVGNGPKQIVKKTWRAPLSSLSIVLMYRCRSPGGNIWNWPIQMESSSLKTNRKVPFLWHMPWILRLSAWFPFSIAYQKLNLEGKRKVALYQKGMGQFRWVFRALVDNLSSILWP